ncbi:ATP synthase subunit b, mitochondrial-like [Uloborus diversus]|uniref:ATP synthase subunit b, mitochondrial-like n=1 Tax=Uloborus diversus TaxID=327109 RepID=UPI00240A34B1|nr:ATP synthase subunit b, mitochondrial-like [Uloborus diversus]
MLRTAFSNKNVSNIAAVRIFRPACFQREESSSAVKVFTPQVYEEDKKKISELLSKDLPKPYDGPERDHVNFPRRVRPEWPGKVRMAFLPDEWFQFFYKKTGVTGPYVFGTGLLTFLFSKEFYVFEEEFSTGCAIFLLAYIAIKKFGPATKEYVHKYIDNEYAEQQKQKDDIMKEIENKIVEVKKNVWHAEGQKILMNAKRENVLMQLEAEYRSRMMQVYTQVKKRLDYQLDLYNTRRKLEQKHMVDWIVNNVVKSITPQQEKEALQKCIEDLKLLSARAH